MIFTRHILRLSALCLFSAMMWPPLHAMAGEAKPEMVAALQELQKLDQRIHAIGYRLVHTNRPLCNSVSYHRGYSTHSAADYGDKASAQTAFGFGTSKSINTVVPGSPAAIAGLRTGDILMSQDKKYDQTVVRRGTAKLTLAFEATETCKSAFEVQPSKKRYANADGQTVAISTALVEFMQDDDELAAVLAHELAHNLLKHRTRLNAKKVNRGFFGQFGKSSKRIKETEIEADRLSIWLMINAGYKPQAAINFWTRYGKKYGKGVFSASTHYRWNKRVRLFEEEITKIATEKKTDGIYPPPLMRQLLEDELSEDLDQAIL